MVAMIQRQAINSTDLLAVSVTPCRKFNSFTPKQMIALNHKCSYSNDFFFVKWWKKITTKMSWTQSNAGELKALESNDGIIRGA